MKRQGKIGHLYASPAEEGFYWALSAMRGANAERRRHLSEMAYEYLGDLIDDGRARASRRRLTYALTRFAAIVATLALVAWAVLS